MRRATYICFEGTDGVGKTTQASKLVQYLTSKGYKVLYTKEPGTNHLPITLTLRDMMLNNQYEDAITRPAREYIGQAIRSIHLEKLVFPSFREYDFIVQDRGILSGYAFGVACGNDFEYLRSMVKQNIVSASQTNDFPVVEPEKLYDHVVYLRGNIYKSLDRALLSKREFAAGDAMESRGHSFMRSVSENMEVMSRSFNTTAIDIEGKSVEEVHEEILTKLNMR